ncbi:MAG: TlpA family protein disulfide reductase [Deltaproteobacteria bacterium]|nr:TlpA family protein disulfide reductase [Deltaproteobacteria bacterium]
MRDFLKTLVLCGFVAGFICCCGSRESDTGQNARKAPDFALQDLDGGVHRLSDFKGDVVILNFFATWCAPCRKEVPDLVRLHKGFAKKGVSVIGVSLDEEGQSVLRPFIKQHGITYPVVMATREMLMDYGGMQGIPTTFLIDHNGSIIDRFVGLVPGHQIESSVRSLLRRRG